MNRAMLEDHLAASERHLAEAQRYVTHQRELVVRGDRDHPFRGLDRGAGLGARPLGYYRNNTMNTRALLDVAVKTGVRRFIFSSTAAVYGNPQRVPVGEAAPPAPMSPYGSSKLMSEIMLTDVAAAHGLKYVILRYFNVAGADPKLRTGQSTVGATHLIKVAVELGLRPQIEVFGTDYDTPDGTCIRDYIHVNDLVRAHSDALAYLRRGGANDTFNCGYGHGYSVLDVIEAVKRTSGRDFAVRLAARRPGDPASIVADAARIRAQLNWTPQFDNSTPSWCMRSPGNASSSTCAPP
jgi:UDP-glucose 4-epimerase